MPLRDGQKFACESCIRGHRVSNCQHDDRPLKLIPPKGRPVKQCEHCRTARKSKSHHGQCDCGSKKEKKKEERVDINPDTGCCCHVGEICQCGRNKSVEARMERVLKRPTQPVKSKPSLSSHGSEGKLTMFTKGHHKPIHRNNNLAHTSGAPYKVPRPHTLHGVPQFAKSQQERDLLDSIPRASDDLWIASDSRSMSPPQISRTNSEESLDDVSPFSFDFDQHFATQAGMSRVRSGLTLDSVSESHAESVSYGDSSRLSYGQDDFLGLNMSPTFNAQFDWPAPAAFSPSDLPLTSGNDFAQSVISQSGDSAYMSVPALTSNSSLTHESETEHYSEYWSDSIPVRNNSSSEDRWVHHGLPLESIVKTGTNMSSRTGSKSRHTSNSSSGTTVNFSSHAEADHTSAIVIPAGSDFTDETADWAWECEFSPVVQQSSDLNRDLNWLF